MDIRQIDKMERNVVLYGLEILQIHELYLCVSGIAVLVLKNFVV